MGYKFSTANILKVSLPVWNPEGQIEHPYFGQMLFTIAINESLDESLAVEIVREGKPKSLKLRRQRLTPLDYRVIPYVFDRAVDFEVQGGLVLQELTLSYLRAWGKNWPERAPSRLAIEAIMNPLRDPGKAPERVVFVSKILPDPVNLGYEDQPNAIVIRANGRPIVSLADFREALQRYYLKDDALYDWDWHRRYYIREFKTPDKPEK